MRRNDGYVGAVVAVAYVVVYAGLVDAGYVEDYINWSVRVDAGGFAGAWHAYDYAGHLELYALMMWLTVWLRSGSEWLVFGLTGLAFVGAAILLARLITQVLGREGIAAPAVFGMLGALLWTVSPTNTEVLVWRVCLHYVVSAIIWFTTLLSTFAYLRDGKRRHLATVGLLALVGVFSLELGYGLPLALAGGGLWAKWRYGDGTWTQVVWPPLLAAGAIAIHLTLTKLTMGAWIGHYGSDAVTALPATEVLAAPWRWAARTGLHYRLWTYSLVVKITAWLAKPLVLLILYGLSAGAAGLAVLAAQLHRGAPWVMLLLWLWLMGAATAVIAPLFFYDLLWVSGDRLGFLPGAFVAAGLASACALLPRRLGVAIGAGLVVLSLVFIRKPLTAWHLSADLETGLLNSYRAEVGTSTGPVYLLGYATNAIGAPVFANFRSNRVNIASQQKTLERRALPEQPFELAQFNAGSVLDTVYAEWGNKKLYVSLKSAGGWWWRGRFGLTDFSDERGGFALSLKEYHYEVVWDTPPPPNAIFLYQTGLHFTRLPYPTPDSPQPLYNQ